MRKLTLEDFLEKAHRVHGDLYDYSKSIYNGLKSKIIIICKEHGEFLQAPDNHLAGQKCPACMEQKFDLNTWISKAKLIHGNKYDYSETIYKNSKSFVDIVCPIHGKFNQRANDHLQGAGCSKCRYENLPQNQCKSHEQFIEEANEVHDNKYDYSIARYIKWEYKLFIICPIHGPFLQQAGSHLQGVGCPRCKESHGERQIRIYLNSKNIEYKTQYKFLDCKYINPLPFDFYILKYHLLIEYDGEQHYKPYSFSSDKSEETMNNNLQLLQLKDQIKTKYAKDNNIRLLRISYLEIDNIENILNIFFI